MKTSVIEMRDMLSVLTVDEVEKRIGEVPGVESATVNYAAGNATVRYDETLLDVADIKILVHQRGQQSAGESQDKDVSEDAPKHKPETKPWGKAKRRKQHRPPLHRPNPLCRKPPRSHLSSSPSRPLLQATGNRGKGRRLRRRQHR